MVAHRTRLNTRLRVTRICRFPPCSRPPDKAVRDLKVPSRKTRARGRLGSMQHGRRGICHNTAFRNDASDVCRLATLPRRSPPCSPARQLREPRMVLSVRPRSTPPAKCCPWNRLGPDSCRMAQQTVVVRVNEKGLGRADGDIMAAHSRMLAALRGLAALMSCRALSISAIDGHKQGGEKEEIGDKRERDRDRHQDAESPARLVTRRGEHQKAGCQNGGRGP